MVFAVNLDVLPIAGLHSSGLEEGSIDYYLDAAWHLILPISIIIFGGIGSLSLYIRSLTLEILKSDYIFFARSRGLPNRDILRFYILPNLYPPVITLLGLSLPGIIGGSVILETIFGIDGMGLLFFPKRPKPRLPRDHGDTYNRSLFNPSWEYAGRPGAFKAEPELQAVNYILR